MLFGNGDFGWVPLYQRPPPPTISLQKNFISNILLLNSTTEKCSLYFIHINFRQHQSLMYWQLFNNNFRFIFYFFLFTFCVPFISLLKEASVCAHRWIIIISKFPFKCGAHRCKYRMKPLRNIVYVAKCLCKHIISITTTICGYTMRIHAFSFISDHWAYWAWSWKHFYARNKGMY